MCKIKYISKTLSFGFKCSIGGGKAYITFNCKINSYLVRRNMKNYGEINVN